MFAIWVHVGHMGIFFLNFGVASTTKKNQPIVGFSDKF